MTRSMKKAAGVAAPTAREVKPNISFPSFDCPSTHSTVAPADDPDDSANTTDSTDEKMARDWERLGEQSRARARQRVRDFADWAVLNPRGLAIIEGEVIAAYGRGGHVSTRDIIGIAREAKGSVSDNRGKPFAFDNDFTAPLARYLVAKHPELAGNIETRGRAYDGIDVLAEVRRAQG